jgi:hypothetical protein
MVSRKRLNVLRTLHVLFRICCIGTQCTEMLKKKILQREKFCCDDGNTSYVKFLLQTIDGSSVGAVTVL